jgi:hypothetical protein
MEDDEKINCKGAKMHYLFEISKKKDDRLFDILY